MRDVDVPVKTDAGRREVEERRFRLSPRQRSLLIAIHGEQTVAELRAQFASLGDFDASLAKLAEDGLVVARAAAARPQRAPAAAPAAFGGLSTVRQFMNETVVAALGLRAFLFTLKLEKCYARQELVELLPEYRRVLAKAKGEEFALAMAQRVEAMLASEPYVDG
ncbi:MAG TPA: hypothetical protein VGC30_05055 [Dokdonella sp.]